MPNRRRKSHGQASPHPQCPHSVTYIRVAALTPFLEHLQGSGISLTTLLDRHAFRSTDLNDPYALIPLHHFVGFLEDAAVATADEAFGARLGAHLKPADIGPMGILFSISPTIRIALQRIARLANSLQGRPIPARCRRMTR